MLNLPNKVSIDTASAPLSEGHEYAPDESLPIVEAPSDFVRRMLPPISFRNFGALHKYALEEMYIGNFSHEFVTTYLTSDVNPLVELASPSATIRDGDVTYLQGWLSTVSAFGNARVIVDRTGNAVALRNSNVVVDIVQRGPRMTADNRFFHFREHLEATETDYLTLTDCASVMVKRHPLSWHALNKKLVISSGGQATPCIGQNDILMQQLLKMAEVGPIDVGTIAAISPKPMVEPSVISGTRDVLLALMTLICDLLMACPKDQSLGLAAVNVAVHSLNLPISVGGPFVSPMGSADLTGQYWIIQK